MRCRPMSETQMGLIPDPAQEVPLPASFARGESYLESLALRACSYSFRLE